MRRITNVDPGYPEYRTDKSKMILTTADNILIVIQAIEALNKAKQAYWRAYAATGKYGGLDDSSKQKLWLSYVKPALDIVMDHFRDFQLYGYIQLYGTGNLKSVEAINLLVDGKGVDSAESDDTATDELIKELETVRQRLISQKSNPPVNTDGSEKNKSPKVFISYSYDSPEHKKWVLDLAIILRENGVDVILDQWDLKLGGDVAKFMESSTDADRVLMICTEPYVKKADEGKGGAGYEAMIVTGELLHDLGTTKFIPVIRQNSGETKLPISVSTRAYINLSNDQSFEQEYEHLLRDLHQAPAVSKPPLGKNPFIAQPSGTNDRENEQSRKGQVEMTNFNQYQVDVFDVVKKVDSLVLKPATRARFIEHIDRFCTMVEDYGQVLQPYAEQFKKTIETRITPEQSEKHRRPDGNIYLDDISPPSNDWIKESSNYSDYNSCLNVPTGLRYRPKEPVNPLLWFEIFGDKNIQRMPTEQEELIYSYVLLDIIHHYKLGSSGGPTGTPVFSDKYDGKWFQWNDFRWRVWKYYEPDQYTTDQAKLLQLNRAFERVQADIDRTKQNGGEVGRSAGEKEIIEIKPSWFGISIDLKEVWRRIWK